MCVTNTTHSRIQAVTLTPSQVGIAPSVLSQRLLGSFGGQTSFAAFPAQPAVDAASTEYVSTISQKSRPKRRRKPQKPGKTAKNNDRHFVVHDYHDHATDADARIQEDDSEAAQRRRGGVSIAFPLKLHAVLNQVEADGLAHVLSWQPHGRCFVIHKPKEFVDHVMPKYFRQTKLTSFQRQLNLYGFQRLTRGADAGGYYHECFLRGKEFLCKKMTRTKVKGTRFKAASSPELEPDFYQMAPITVSPNNSDEEQSFDSSGRRLTGFAQPSITTSASSQQSVHFPILSQPSITMNAASFSLLSNTGMARTHEADRVLDEAVDELFLNETGDVDNLADFVHDWDPTSNFGAVLEDDAQLGFMLDKLLED